jgi:membrane dipeptidase
MAFWSDNSLDGDENYRIFREAYQNLLPMLGQEERFHAVLAVEGGRLLNNDLSRLDVLRACGVRILTLVWGGLCCMGGAHDTDEGLTDFGRQVVDRCFDLGIVPDLSHASDKMFYETATMAKERGKAIIVSHSCSRAVCDHSRNLTDEMAKITADLGGIIGVNLVIPHLGDDTVEQVCRHITHFASVAGEDHVCLGCDLDGTAHLPQGIKNVGDLTKIADGLRKNSHSEAFIEKVFYTNAQTFAVKHFC